MPRSRLAVAAPALAAAGTALAGTLVVRSQADRLPEPVATHWGTSGPDGFSPLADSLWTTAVLFAPLVLVLTAVTAVAPRSARGAVAGFGVGTPVGLGVLVYGSTLRQAGLDDAALAPGPGPLVPLALLVGAAVGTLAGWSLRVPAPLLPADRAGLTVPPSEREVWTGTAGVGRRAQLVVVVVTVALAVATALLDVWVAVVPLVVGAVVLLCASATVRVDHRGLLVRAAGVAPVVRVPLERVESADVTQVQAFAEFGGWGSRVGLDGRRAFLTRSGTALRVRRVDEPDVLVTVDDPEGAARVLAALVAAARSV
ncbi:SdpI family protein [Thalassiella azotivora]